MKSLPINIYALVNPKNNKVFYVGATGNSLKTRLKHHILRLNVIHYKSGTTIERKILLDKLRAEGLSFKIKLLEVIPFKLSSECERKWYNYFKLKGHNLLQRNTGDFQKQYLSKRKGKKYSPMSEFITIKK
jgi:hypothetical protein